MSDQPRWEYHLQRSNADGTDGLCGSRHKRWWCTTDNECARCIINRLTAERDAAVARAEKEREYANEQLAVAYDNVKRAEKAERERDGARESAQMVLRDMTKVQTEHANMTTALMSYMSALEVALLRAEAAETALNVQSGRDKQ